MMLLVYAALSYLSKRSASQRNSLSSERQASIKYSCSKACQQLVKHVSKRVAAELSEQRATDINQVFLHLSPIKLQARKKNEQPYQTRKKKGENQIKKYSCTSALSNANFLPHGVSPPPLSKYIPVVEHVSS